MGITVRINIKRGEEIERVKFKEEEKKKSSSLTRSRKKADQEEEIIMDGN